MSRKRARNGTPPGPVQRQTIYRAELPWPVDPERGVPALRWDFTPAEKQLAELIAQRLVELAREHGQDQPIDTFGCVMDLLAVHCNCVRLNLLGLLAAGPDDFSHDVLGIGRFIDRSTGKLREGFRPRFALAGGLL